MSRKDLEDMQEVRELQELQEMWDTQYISTKDIWHKYELQSMYE